MQNMWIFLTWRLGVYSGHLGCDAFFVSEWKIKFGLPNLPIGAYLDAIEPALSYL